MVAGPFSTPNDTTTLGRLRSRRRRMRIRDGDWSGLPLPALRSRTLGENGASRHDGGGEAGSPHEEGSMAGLVERLREQRKRAATVLAARLSSKGVDRTVCAFLEDDLREAADALADAENFFQERIEALSAAVPSSDALIDRASDCSGFGYADHLYEVLWSLRRRLVQVAAGLRYADRRPR